MRTPIASPAQGSAEQLSEPGSTKDPWYRRYPRRLLSPKDVPRQQGQSRWRLARSKSPDNDQARTQSPDDGQERQERPASSGSESTPTPSIELRRSNTDLSAELPFSAAFSQAGLIPAPQVCYQSGRSVGYLTRHRRLAARPDSAKVTKFKLSAQHSRSAIKRQKLAYGNWPEKS